MLTDTDRQHFDWITQRARDLAAIAASPLTQPLASALLPILLSESVAAFPAVGTALKSMQAHARQQATLQMAQTGPALWKTLHTRALAAVGLSASDELRWLTAEFPKALPCGECKAFYFQFLQQTKPDFSNYFAWTVDLHNAVNRKLGKPELSLPDARDFWTTKG